MEEGFLDSVEASALAFVFVSEVSGYGNGGVVG